MNIIEVRPVQKTDIAVKVNTEVVPKSYISVLFELNNKTYTAAIRISTNYIAECINEKNQSVKISKETEDKLILAITEFNKKIDI